MDGFTKVKKKNRRKQSRDEYDETSPLYQEKLIRKTQDAIEQFDNDPQLFASLNSLNQALAVVGSSTTLEKIICYGLGSLSNSKSSVFQLALILKIAAHLDTKTVFFDPVFTTADVRLLESLKCSLTDDDGGKRRVDGATMFFLPHAPRFLLENIIATNWGPNLSNCIIFGDNVLTIIENSPTRVLKDNYQFLYESHTLLDTFEVQNTFRFNDVFNDFAVHVFAPSRLAEVDQSTWNLEVKPASE